MVLLTHVSGSRAGLQLMKVSFFQGQTPAGADLAILALMYSTWLTFPVRLPTLGWSCQVPAHSFLFSKLFSPAHREHSSFSNVHTPLVGSFLGFLAPQKQQKQNWGGLVVCWNLPPITGIGIRTHLAKVNSKAGRLKKIGFYETCLFFGRAKSIFHLEQNAKLFSADYSILYCQASFSAQDDRASGL